jgi:uncharacterized membrane protein
MAAPISNRIPFRGAPVAHSLLLVPAMAVLIFLALPWSIEHKAHMALHGLCAQQPTHTYRFGDRLLPFDSRMTGIYTGYLMTSIMLFRAGAHRWCRPPSWSRLAVLAAFGGVMAVDGFNSFVKDLELPYLYQPQNWLRLVTGMMAGIVLGFALCFLTASTVWKAVDTRRQTLERISLLPRIVLAWIPIGLAVTSGVGAFYVPLTLLLVFSAALALTSLSLVVLVILRRRDFTFAGVSSLGGYGLGAMGLAVVAMAMLSLGRALLERALGTPPLT